MPDSERDRQDANEESVAAEERKKAAKKPAKKATKKTAKKAVVKEAAPEAPAEQTAIDRIGETLDAVIAEARAQGIPALLGTATVRLVMTVEGAATPADAVRRFISTCANEGLSHWSYVVTDEETGEAYIVNDGQVVRIEETSGAG